MDFQNGKIQNESLDIISELFQRFTSANSISAKEFQSIEHLKSMSESVDLFMKSSSRKSEMEQLLSRIGEPVHSLCMPYWIWTPEFDKASRDYFTEKKEIKRGPMKSLVHRQSEFINTLAPILQHIEQETSLGFYRSSLFQIEDILLA